MTNPTYGTASQPSNPSSPASGTGSSNSGQPFDLGALVNSLNVGNLSEQGVKVMLTGVGCCIYSFMADKVSDEGYGSIARFAENTDGTALALGIGCLAFAYTALRK